MIRIICFFICAFQIENQGYIYYINSNFIYQKHIIHNNTLTWDTDPDFSATKFNPTPFKNLNKKVKTLIIKNKKKHSNSDTILVYDWDCYSVGKGTGYFGKHLAFFSMRDSSITLRSYAIVNDSVLSKKEVLRHFSISNISNKKQLVLNDLDNPGIKIYFSKNLK